MPALLVTNHKGGVGKTFVSVHLAKVLSEQGNRVLLVDCDGQYDSFKFFARHKETTDGVISMEISQSLTLLANKECRSLRSYRFDEDNYDYVVLDGDARMADTVKNILQNEIKLVLVPVNSQQLAIDNLEDLFHAVARLNLLAGPFGEFVEGTEARSKQVAKSVASQLIVIPLDADEDRLHEFLKRFGVKTKVKIHQNMPRMAAETNQSLTEGVPIWEVKGLPSTGRLLVRRYFEDLADKVKKFFQ